MIPWAFDKLFLIFLPSSKPASVYEENADQLFHV